MKLQSEGGVHVRVKTTEEKRIISNPDLTLCVCDVFCICVFTTNINSWCILCPSAFRTAAAK